MKTLSIALFFGVVSYASLGSALAQTQAPIVVQAITAAPTPAPPAVAAPPAESAQATLKLLQEIKAANEAVLARQAATIEQLDEIEKSAEQIKIYSKRG